MSNWNLETIQAVFDSILHLEEPDSPKYKKQQRILKAAADLFQKYGYRKTSMDDVAREAGVAKGTLYLYFKTKVDLVVQVVALEKKQHMQEMAPLFKETDPVVRLKEYVKLAMVLASKMPITSKLATGDSDMLGIIDEIDEETRAKSEEFGMAIITSFIEEAASHPLSKKELLEQATVLKSILYFSLKMVDERICGDMGIEKFAEVLSGMLVDGMAGPQSSDATEGRTK